MANLLSARDSSGRRIIREQLDNLKTSMVKTSNLSPESFLFIFF